MIFNKTSMCSFDYRISYSNLINRNLLCDENEEIISNIKYLSWTTISRETAQS
jgi:hypothetical protein